jgi:hypothetical protein
VSSSYPNSYLRTLDHPDSSREQARIMGDRREAVLPDMTRLRVTPPGQPDVAALVHVGDVIGTNYAVGGVVYRVSKYQLHGLTVFGITWIPFGTERTKTGKVPESAKRWLNELVAQDGRILHLFVSNEDEVTVTRSTLMEMLI